MPRLTDVERGRERSRGVWSTVRYTTSSLVNRQDGHGLGSPPLILFCRQIKTGPVVTLRRRQLGPPEARFALLLHNYSYSDLCSTTLEHSQASLATVRRKVFACRQQGNGAQTLVSLKIQPGKPAAPLTGSSRNSPPLV